MIAGTSLWYVRLRNTLGRRGHAPSERSHHAEAYHGSRGRATRRARRGPRPERLRRGLLLVFVGLRRRAGQGRHAHRHLSGRAPRSRPGDRLGGQGWAIEHCLFNNFIKYASAPGKAGTQMLPDLATEIPTPANGGVTDGGKTYTFHLKKGIKFAPPVDREVTSADFKYSFERMMADPKAPATGFYSGIVGANAFMAGKAKTIGRLRDARPVHGAYPPREARHGVHGRDGDVVHRRRGQGVGTENGAGRSIVTRWAPAPTCWTTGPRPRDPRHGATPTTTTPLPRHLDGVRFGVLAQPDDRPPEASARRSERARPTYIPPADYARVKVDPSTRKLVTEEPVIANRLPVPEPHREAVRQPQGAPGRRQMAIDRERIVKLLGGAADPLDAAVPGRPGRPSGRRRR